MVADDADLGGKRAGTCMRVPENKVPLATAFEVDGGGPPLHVRFDLLPAGK